MEFFLVRIFPYSDVIQENTDPKKLCIWTLHAVLFPIRKNAKVITVLKTNLLLSARIQKHLANI